MFDIDVLLELRQRFIEGTEADLEREGRSLNPLEKGEKALGTIHSMDVRRMFATATECDKRAFQALLDARYKSGSAEEARSLNETHAYYHTLAGIARDIGWAQAKKDSGVEAWEAKSLSLRADWMLVEGQPDNPLARMLGSLRLPGMPGPE